MIHPTTPKLIYDTFNNKNIKGEYLITEYTLFLDESYDNQTDLFCIAGCIVKNSNLQDLHIEIDNIKRVIWTPTELHSLFPILHSTELNIAYKNKNNPQISHFTKGSYTVFNSKIVLI